VRFGPWGLSAIKSYGGIVNYDLRRMAGLRVENDTLSNMKWILSILLGFAPAFAVDAPAPSVFTMPTQFQRVVIVRLKHQTDILEGLKEAVVREKIKNAVILSGFGSVISYHIHVVNNTTFPPKDVFAQEKGAFDILTVSGLVMDGRVHPHISLSSPQKTIGGHIEPGTQVMTFATITLGVLPDSLDLKRMDDWNWH
jgi:uncharacterized protein